MNKTIDDPFTVSPIHMFFLMYVSLVGMGMMSFQHHIVPIAGGDAWISTLLSVLFIFVLVWMMFRILEVQQPGEEHLVAINRRYFGKIIGFLLNTAFFLYIVMGTFYAFRFYLEVIQVWVFPLMNLWPIGLIIMGLFYYLVTGGFQTVAGLCFWGTVFILGFIFTQMFLITPYLHIRNLLPIYSHSISQIMEAGRTMSYQFLGCELLFIFYPYVQSKEKSRKWGYLSVAVSGFIYLTVLLITLTYFDLNQIHMILWPTLSIISMIELPLMQRMEYLILTLWLIKLLANTGLGIWAACQIMKRGMKMKPRPAIFIILGLFIVLMFIISDPTRLQLMGKLYEQIGGYLIFLYIPLLFVIARTIDFWRKRRKKSSSA